MKNISIMNVEYIFLSSLVWCTFNESFTWTNALCGVVLGRVFFILSQKFLKEEKLKKTRIGNCKNFSITLYFIRLLVDMYINTVGLIYLLVTKRLDPTLVKVKTKSRGKVGALIANSITLTPKTSCIDKEGDMLTVLCAYEMTRSDIIDTLEIRTLKEKSLIPTSEFIKEV